MRLYSRNSFILLIVIIGLTFLIYGNFLSLIEARQGVVLNDPVLNILPVFDLSLPIFIFIYGALLANIPYLIGHPEEAFYLGVGYEFMLLLRMIMMALVNLDPPPGMIILADPLAEIFTSGVESISLTRDLFFSGHTATLTLFTLAQTKKSWKVVFSLVTFLVASMLLLQHVHYTIDILVGLIVAIFIHQLVQKMRPIQHF